MAKMSSSKHAKHFNDITGMRFGRLVAIEFCKSTNKWVCQCDCSNVTSVASGSLRFGITKSCGCLYREMVKKAPLKHGLSHSGEYRTWLCMRQRCYNKNDGRYRDYGGRGIRVCQEWHKFENFFADMDPKPSSAHSIERLDNDGHYEPCNCIWATPKRQARNRSTNILISFNNETKLMIEWAEMIGIKYDTLKSRLRKNNWSVVRAITEPVLFKQKRE